MRCYLPYVFVCVLVTGSLARSLQTGKAAPATSGKCGDNLTWSYDSTSSILTISGTGLMYNYTSCGPWSSFDNTMRTIMVNNGVESIGNFAFAACSKVENVTMGGSIKILGSRSFYLASSLISIKLSNSLESIGSFAFFGAGSLKSIELPNSLLRIEQYAFNFASALTSLTIPASVSYIHETSFRGCTSVTSFSVNKNNTYFSSIDGVLFNKNGTMIYFYPPSNSRTNYTIPANVTKIGSCAFYRTKHLNSINVESKNEYYSSRDGVLFNKDLTTLIRYPSKKMSAKYSVPGTVKTITGSSFYRGSNLESIIIQEGVTTIENSAFCFCTKLKTISLPSSVRIIEGGIVYKCDSLSLISVNENNPAYKSEDGVLFSKDGKTIVQYPKGKSDTHYTIPSGVTVIGDSAQQLAKHYSSIWS